MKSSLLFGCLLAGVLSAMSAAPLEASENGAAAAPAAVRLAQRTLHDAQAGVDAMTLLAPDGWVVDHRIDWHIEGAQPVTLTATAADPTRGRQVLWLPRECFIVAPSELIAMTRPSTTVPSTQPAATTQPLTWNGVPVLNKAPDIRTYVEQTLLPRYQGVQNLTIVSITPLPATTRAFEVRMREELANGFAPADRLDVAVARVRVHFTHEQRLWEDDIYIAMTVWSAAWMRAHLEAMQIEGTYALVSIERIFALRAPRGELDAATPLLLSVALSPRPTVQWTEVLLRVHELRQERDAGRQPMFISRRDRAEACTRRAINQETRIAWAIAADIAGMAVYVDPSNDSQQVLLPDGFAHVWSDGNGGVLLADNASPNPAENSRRWTRLDRK